MAVVNLDPPVSVSSDKSARPVACKALRALPVCRGRVGLRGRLPHPPPRRLGGSSRLLWKLRSGAAAKSRVHVVAFGI